VANRLIHRVAKIKVEVAATYLACRHPRTPWYAKAVALAVLAYAFSPLDLIPDPVPVLGHLDDLVLIPLGIALVRWLIPKIVWEECRNRARGESVGKVRGTAWAAILIVTAWLLLAAAVLSWALRLFHRP
jgi:uncharacterized membrane protein YkvA (DUF1232 family)